ncbi:hypothetical protein EDC56_2229 [Sinobacterium caligoides]|uniref:Uncharacterized protein n=1 Tax=Sinobacterium caligoides TaxID=933926 RepID=A0A3N2DPN6_9GAMM|nr:hypothetical protein [Sinobacterium caligoides]ROS01784.1 hypothetical protein EDC56_2229 [Sinobacterium caligoides]
MTDDQLQFIDYRKPALNAGDYIFTVKHKIPDPEQGENGISEAQKIHVRAHAERVMIAPDTVYAQYPPAGETGQYGDVLPHLSLKKGILPWMRSSSSDINGEFVAEDNSPWLQLIGVTEKDIEQGDATALKTCKIDNLAEGAYFPSLQLKSLKKERDNNSLVAMPEGVKTITIKKSLFDSFFFNKAQDADLLAHLRRRWTAPIDRDKSDKKLLLDELVNKIGNKKEYIFDCDINERLGLKATAIKLDEIVKNETWLVSDPHEGDVLLERIVENDSVHSIRISTLSRELAVVVANRFGEADAVNYPGGMRNYSLLVSLEGYFTDDSIEAIEKLGDDEMIRLVVLTSWWFNCSQEKVDFGERAKALDVESLRYSTKQLKKTEGSLKRRLEAGYVALPHQFRQGDESISWYRGPFAPTLVGDMSVIALSENQRGESEGGFVATDADRLMSFCVEDGMFDVSYSVAYELGRFMSFKNTSFNNALGKYKQGQSRYRQLLSDEERRASAINKGIFIEKLPYAQLEEGVTDQQLKEIEAWLLRLASFENIPVWNLLPDPDLLPEKALRTFRVDPVWVQSLWLGALSLNGRPEITNRLFTECYKRLNKEIPGYGAFVRSDIVWAYPEREIKFRNIGEDNISDSIDLDPTKITAEHGDYMAYISSFHPKNIYSHRRIARDAEIYLSKESFDYLSLSLPVESLHYGANVDEKNNYTKSVKYKGKSVGGPVDIKMRHATKSIINATILADNLTNLLMENSDDKFSFSLREDGFSSARFSRFMLEGEPQVEFSVEKLS